LAREDALCLGPTDAKNIRERDLDALGNGQIDTCDACHAYSLTLALFVLGVLLADDPVDAFTADHLAVLAQPFDRGPDFHGFPQWDIRRDIGRDIGALLESVDDAAAAEVVGRDLHQDPVTGKNADEILSHLAADVRKHLVLVLQLNPEHGIGQ
jgi:hypothetical protein